MTTMEILMLVGGLAAFVISFFLPDGNTAEAGEGISQEELQQLFDDEVELSRQKIDDMTKETLDYSMEKTERSLEKIANEKIMAVGEYSDTVLDQINQSHNQVVFLSDMLRKSKDELTELLNRADRTSKDANERANEAYDLAGNAMKLAEDAAERAEEAGRTAVSAEEKMIDARRIIHEGTERREVSDALDIPEDLEVPGEIFEDLVSEFSLDDESEEMEEETAPRRGAEERLAESLSAFRESLKEKTDDTEEGDSKASYEEETDAETDADVEGSSDAETEETEFFRITDFIDKEGEEPASLVDVENAEQKSAEDGFAPLNDLIGTEIREFTETGAEKAPMSVSQPEMEVPTENWDEEYAGMTEEEKMEALLKAATEELAQDVSAVTGLSEMRWEPTEASAEEVEAEDNEEASVEEEREAKARALEALKDEAETEYRENKAKALEALKAEAELAAAQPVAEEEMTPAEDAEFLQSLLKGGDFADIAEAEESAAEGSASEDAEALLKEIQETADETSEPADAVKAEDPEEKKAAPAKKTTARKSSKKSTKSGSTGRKKAAKQDGQMSIPEELLQQDSVSLQFAPGEETTKNNNARILEMHRMGRSDMAIAKDLGMGIGEVKLVIALDEIS